VSERLRRQRWKDCVFVRALTAEERAKAKKQKELLKQADAILKRRAPAEGEGEAEP
jgi:hypothetical protein